MTAVETGPAMRFSVDGWDPGYGTSAELEDDLGESTARVDESVEVPASQWRPIDPDPSGPVPAAMLFVDGVRRVEARVWIDSPGTGLALDASAALCASYAAGVVCCCDGQAHIASVQLRRGLFTVEPAATTIATWAGDYTAVPVTPNPAADPLSPALQRKLGEVEVITAVAARAAMPGHGVPPDSDLLIVDGPLLGRQHLPRALGYIKSQHRRYLTPDLNGLVAQLRPGQRSPAFLMGTNWERHSWYLRLPGGSGAPWAGIVRIECPADLPIEEVTALAAQSQRCLPRFASAAYKDSRAPQNLYPIAGLERELRRRLGDPRLLYRALRQAAAA